MSELNMFTAADRVLDALIDAIAGVMDGDPVFDEVSPLDALEVEPAHRPANLPKRFAVLQDQDLDWIPDGCAPMVRVTTFLEIGVGGKSASREIRALCAKVVAAILPSLSVAGHDVDTIEIPQARIRDVPELHLRAAAMSVRVTVSAA